MTEKTNNNITEKLRNHVTGVESPVFENSVRQLMLDAADEIECLQDEIKKADDAERLQKIVVDMNSAPLFPHVKMRLEDVQFLIRLSLDCLHERKGIS